MDKNIEISMLYDIYGNLLTKRQQSIFEEYYIYNLSLREIAENKDISYQAVRDSIKSSEKMLENFENIVGMYKYKEKILGFLNEIKLEKNLENIKEKVDELLNSEDDI